MSNDDAVGYGKPPKHSRFKPGQSGNPRGREKGSRGLKTDLAKELRAKHTIQVNGQPVSGTRQQMLLRTLAIRAASGDLKAAHLLLPTIMQVLGIEDRGGSKETLSTSDQLLLNELLGEHAGSQSAKQVLDKLQLADAADINRVEDDVAPDTQSGEGW